MKKVVLFLFAITFLMGCGTSVDSEKLVANASTSMKISGMICQEKCAGRIEGKIARMAGVQSCEVDFENEMATIMYNTEKVNIETVVEKVEEMSDGKYSISDIETNKLKNTSSELNSSGGSESGQILTVPSFKLPNLADYFRNLI